MASPDPSATRDHWDGLAATYDRAKGRNDAYYAALKETLAWAVPVAHRRRVLEVGCGTGQVLASLQPLNGVGIDASAKMIEVAQRNFGHRRELTFAAMPAEALSGLGEFDAVISADVMEHVDDWQAVVRGMVAACSAGGLIAITTPNPAWTLPLLALEKLRLKMPEGPHQFVGRGKLARLLRDCGCVVTHCGTHLMIPLRLRGVGVMISTLAERTVLLRELGVIQLVVARKPGTASAPR